MVKANSERWAEYQAGIEKDRDKELLKTFLGDFELGINVPKNSPGARKPATLLRLGRCLESVFEKIPKEILSITKRDLHQFFKDMKDGKIKKVGGESYKDTAEFIKNIKVFYGWLKRTDLIKEDISEELSTSAHKGDKPGWVYLGHETMKALIDSVRGDYRALIMFLYDSGLRPQEAWKIKVCDFLEDYTSLHVPDKRNGEKVSKTFERTIKLKHCSSLLKQYVELNNLKAEDNLIQIEQSAFNKHLKVSVLRLLGNPEEREIITKKGKKKKIFYTDITTKARGRLSEFKCYDIRHNSACYWLDRYQLNKDLMYRFGWLREDKVFYYSEFLGRRDNIDDTDMLTKEDRTKLEVEFDMMKKENEKTSKIIAVILQEMKQLMNSSNPQELLTLLYKKIEEQEGVNSFS